VINLEEKAYSSIPRILVKPPGPKVKSLVEEELKYYAPGYSGIYYKIPMAFDEAKGAIVKDLDGNIYIDFTSGVLVCSPGHSHPKVVNAIKNQVEKLQNIYPFCTEARLRLLKKLSEILPKNLKRMFFMSGGAEALEHAMKLAKAYTKKYEFISFFGGFHGKSHGALSLSCLPGSRKGFGPLLYGFLHAPYAYCYRCSFGLEYPSCNLNCVRFLEDLVQYQSTGSIAGLVIEPIQVAFGSVVPPKEFIVEVAKFCKEQGILLMVDEISTGLGRTGKLWGIEHYGVQPDIMTLGKAIGGGIPISVVAAKEEIVNAELWARPYASSTTFGGNPIACAAASAAIEAILEENLIENAAKVGEAMLKRLKEMKEEHELIGDVRGVGLLAGIELVEDQKSKKPAIKETELVLRKALEKGLLIHSAGFENVLRIVPPLCISMELMEKGLEIISEAIKEVEKSI
jgi:4-aminobutyrate aminotransferase